MQVRRKAPLGGMGCIIVANTVSHKVIIDSDPGIDDAVALTLALFDADLEVLAITATAGNVDAAQATRNVQVAVEQLDPPRWPRLGAALSAGATPSLHAKHIHGPDGLGGANFPCAELQNRHPSDKLIADTVRAHPHELTLLALGPLTNVASAFRRDPELPRLLQRLLFMGGSVAAGGNVTAAAEFNVHYDPMAAREVLQAPVRKVMIPLDVTQQFVFTFNHFDRLPSQRTRPGRFLRTILPFAFRAHHHHLGLEGVHLHDVLALAALVKPTLFRMQAMACDVELTGEITRGATVLDRRRDAPAVNVEVAMEVDVAGLVDYIWSTLAAAAERNC